MQGTVVVKVATETRGQLIPAVGLCAAAECTDCKLARLNRTSVDIDENFDVVAATPNDHSNNFERQKLLECHFLGNAHHVGDIEFGHGLL
jgi:hypothetical protein